MDKYSQFCAEFKALLEKYNAKITAISDDDDGRPFIDGVFVEGEGFKPRPLVRECDLCKTAIEIMPCNIGSHG